MTQSKLPPASLAWSVWGLAAMLYLIGFYQRVAPAVMTGELSAEFGLSAAALGNLSAFYFYSYVAMQIPTGIIADRWGPRRLLTLGAAIAAIGTLLFAIAPTLAFANLGRLLIGGSVAVAFVCMLKLAGHWMAPRQFALASGMALFVGIVGGVFAGVPLRLLVSSFGWRPVMFTGAMLTAAVAIAIWALVRDDPVERGYKSHAPDDHAGTGIPSALGGLLRVLNYRNSWLLFVIAGGVAGPVLAFAGLWGVPFLTTHYAMSGAEAAAITSTLLVAWAIGAPALGSISDRLGRRKPLYVAGCAIATAAWTVVLFVPDLPIPLLLALLIVIGFASGNMVISYAFVKESVPIAIAGTATGLTNMGTMLGPMLLQPAIGVMLDRHWRGAMESGIRFYDLAAYRAGFALMLGWALLALILISFTRETFCKQNTSTMGEQNQ
ncbi:MAG: MFS transporter [Burkholderiales bacterium]|nr:MFS transporter [Burkholderiales bacterium]